MKKLYFCLTALLFMAAGCSNDELADNGTKSPVVQKSTITTINATMEDANTRTILVDGHKVVWQEDDVISVLSNESDYEEWSNYENYYINSGVGTTSATFSGNEISGTTFYAFSPSSIDEWDVAKEQFNMYWNYSAIFGDETEENNYVIPMAAKSKDNNMQFKQLGGLLHFQIKGSSQLTGVYLRGNNNEEFPDYITIDLSSEEPALTFDLNEGFQEEIYCEPEYYDQMLSKTEPLDVYILLPAGMTFSKGVTLKVQTYDIDEDSWSSTEKRTNQPITISRAKVTHFKSFDIEEEAIVQKENNFHILMDFYQAMDGDNWDDNYGWGDEDIPFEEWSGIWAEGSTIRGIIINSNGGEGTIPEGLAALNLKNLCLNNFSSLNIDNVYKLTSLNELQLVYDNLSGDLPEDFAKLTNLNHLDLVGNQFTGSIPDLWLEKLTQLYRLDLSYNNLSGTISVAQQSKYVWQNCERKQINPQNNDQKLIVENGVYEIEVNNRSIVLNVGESNQLVTTVLHNNCSDTSLTININWYDDEGNSGDSADDAPFTIADDGTITALRPGGGNLEIYSNDGNSIYMDCYITIPDPNE